MSDTYDAAMEIREEIQRTGGELAERIEKLTSAVDRLGAYLERIADAADARATLPPPATIRQEGNTW
ncbi:MAG TPA: hypothetical protein VK066_20000 [Chloroflexota bacterium]|nr:hypothetical protein [Chloroflexota bacterium]